VSRDIRGFISDLKSSKKFVMVEFKSRTVGGVGLLADLPEVAWA
jgi:hypothetical protein